jgi:hypothetical protein
MQEGFLGGSPQESHSSAVNRDNFLERRFPPLLRRIPEEMPMERLMSICMSDRAALAGISWRLSA